MQPQQLKIVSSSHEHVASTISSVEKSGGLLHVDGTFIWSTNRDHGNALFHPLRHGCDPCRPEVTVQRSARRESRTNDLDDRRLLILPAGRPSGSVRYGHHGHGM